MWFVSNATHLIRCRVRRQLRARTVAAVMSIGSVVLAAQAVQAQMERPATDLMAKQFDTKVITVADMINRGLWSLAREAFDHEETLQIGQGPVEPKPRGFEFLLFCPGDFGATVRYRW
jgi:hypothetical protein